MTQVIDLGKLRFHFAGDWSGSTTYESNDIVKYGGNVYVYTYGLKTSGNLPTSTTYWALMVEGFKFKGVFDTAVQYRVGDGVAHGGKVYVAVIDSTGQTPPNTTFWSQFADGIQYEGAYIDVKAYQKNDIVTLGGVVYIAKVDTTGNNPTNTTFWDRFVDGISPQAVFNGATAYVVGDMVPYGSNIYRCIQNTTGNLPTNTAFWLPFLYGFSNRGVWSPGSAYKIGEVVTRGGSTYQAIADNNGVDPAITPLIWDKLTFGFKNRGAWSNGTEYVTDDVVVYGGNTYIALLPHASTVFETNLAAGNWQKFNSGVRWRGNWTASTSYLKDDIVKDSVGSAYIATQDYTSGADFSVDLTDGKWEVFVLGGSDVLPALQAGDAGKSLTVLGNGSGLDWMGTTQSDRVFYVAPHGVDSPASGKNITAPYASIRYACDNAPNGSTIFVKTGVYIEQLPITIPTNTAIVGDSQRTVEVMPAPGLSDDGVTPNAQATMFLMSDGSVLNRMTFKGMTGWVYNSASSDITASTIRGVVLRLNPATPITHKSPYVLECSFIGTGAIGALVDGSVHATGNRSIIFHAYTIISDNGVGIWVKDGGKSEIVSCFTYFCQFGYAASGGGFIRALNGNNSYGTWGAVSRGFNANEAPLTGNLVGRYINFVYSGGNINVGDTVTSSTGTAPSVTFVVTTVPNPAGAGNIYQIDGVNYPVLALVRGGVYTFDQSDASNVGHQVAFKDGTGASYTIGVATTGVLGQAGAKTVLTVANDAPDDLRYYCVAHGNGMGNTITVTGNGVVGGAVITGSAVVTNVQYSANKVYVKNDTGTFEPGTTLTFSSGGTGGVNPGGIEDQKGFVLVAKGFATLPKPGSSIQLIGDSFAYVIQSVSGSYVDGDSELVFVLAQEKPTGSPSGTVVTIRTQYSQIRLTGHDFLSIGTGGTATTNYPGLPLQPSAQGNETDENYPGRVYYVSTDQDGNFRVGEYFRIDQATGRATLNANAFDLAGLTSLRLGSIGAQLGETINEFSSDATLSDNSNVAVPTEYAVKTYVDSKVGAVSVDAIPFVTTISSSRSATAGAMTFSMETLTISGSSVYTIPTGAYHFVLNPNGFALFQ